MAIIDILKQIEFESLSDEQKISLGRLLQKHRRDLRTALAAVERGLQQLAPEPPTRQPPSPAGARKRKQGS